MVMACAVALGTAPIAIFDVVSSPIDYTYRGLADLHSDLGRTSQIPLEIWDDGSGLMSMRGSFEARTWLFILFALVFFSLLGSTREAMNHYHNGLKAVARVFGISSMTPTPTFLPVTRPTVSSVIFGDAHVVRGQPLPPHTSSPTFLGVT